MIEAGVEIIKRKPDNGKALVKKVIRFRQQGLSYQKIADLLNLWRIETKSGEGKWYPKTVQDLVSFISFL